MSTSQVKLDLLAWRPSRWLWRWPAFPVALQALALAVVVALIAVGITVGGRSPDELMTLRKTNLTTLAVWGLWWPGMIAVALAFGRAWCTVCPMELALGAASPRRVDHGSPGRPRGHGRPVHLGAHGVGAAADAVR